MWFEKWSLVGGGGHRGHGPPPPLIPLHFSLPCCENPLLPCCLALEPADDRLKLLQTVSQKKPSHLCYGYILYLSHKKVTYGTSRKVLSCSVCSDCTRVRLWALEETSVMSNVCFVPAMDPWISLFTWKIELSLIHGVGFFRLSILNSIWHI